MVLRICHPHPSPYYPPLPVVLSLLSAEKWLTKGVDELFLLLPCCGKWQMTLTRN